MDAKSRSRWPAPAGKWTAPPSPSILIKRVEAAFGRRNPKRRTAQKAVLLFGDPSEIRTPDTLLKRQVLCRLSYWVRSKKFCAEYEIKSYAIMAGTAGFAFQRESHGGSNNPPDYSQEPPFESKDSKSAIMAGTAGFEPANVGVKGRCLTAWRRPRIRLLETALP